jgi:hypothetical protein
MNTLKFARRAKRIQPKPEARPIVDDKTLLKKYRIAVDELKVKLAETNLELEKQKEKDNELSLDERDVYETKLEDARVVDLIDIGSNGFSWTNRPFS